MVVLPHIAPLIVVIKLAGIPSGIIIVLIPRLILLKLLLLLLMVIVVVAIAVLILLVVVASVLILVDLRVVHVLNAAVMLNWRVAVLVARL